MNHLPILRAMAVAVLLGTFLLADDKNDEKDEKKPEPPELKLSVPLAVMPGETVKVFVRGLRLDKATEVRLPGGQGTAKLLKQEKAQVPNNQDPKLIGDTQVEVELALPAELPAGTLPVVVVTPDGESKPYEILVGSEVPRIVEKENNNGFDNAQPIALPQVVDGAIHQGQNVDVFRFEGKAGQTVVCEVVAARRGAGLDASLTLYDAQGHPLAFADDQAESIDPRLEYKLPATGVYYVCLMDALDQGGPAHPYRLIVTAGK